MWPLSRGARPKQLLALTNGRSLIQNTLDRIGRLVPAERTLILTEASHARELHAQVPHVPAENVIVEPARRGTAGALALGAAIIHQRDPEAVMASVHSDSFITDDDEFTRTLGAALEASASTQLLLTLGIEPSFPSTQLGYIHAAEQVAESRGYSVHRVAEFKEKPDADTARAYVEVGGYYWNPGVFIWPVSVILEEFRRYQPEIAASIGELQPYIGSAGQTEALTRIYPSVKIETIDVGIMERSNRVGVIPSSFGWADVGSWAELWDILPKDSSGNVSVGRALARDSRNTLTFSRDRLIATIGLEDVIVVDTGDAILVCHRDRAQETKQLVEALEAAGETELL